MKLKRFYIGNLIEVVEGNEFTTQIPFFLNAGAGTTPDEKLLQEAQKCYPSSEPDCLGNGVFCFNGDVDVSVDGWAEISENAYSGLQSALKQLTLLPFLDSVSVVNETSGDLFFIGMINESIDGYEYKYKFATTLQVKPTESPADVLRAAAAEWRNDANGTNPPEISGDEYIFNGDIHVSPGSFVQISKEIYEELSSTGLF